MYVLKMQFKVTFRSYSKVSCSHEVRERQ